MTLLKSDTLNMEATKVYNDCKSLVEHHASHTLQDSVKNAQGTMTPKRQVPVH